MHLSYISASVLFELKFMLLNKWTHRSFQPWSTILLFNSFVFVGLGRIIILRLLYVSDVCFLQLTTRLSFFAGKHCSKIQFWMLVMRHLSVAAFLFDCLCSFTYDTHSHAVGTTVPVQRADKLFSVNSQPRSLTNSLPTSFSCTPNRRHSSPSTKFP